MSLLKQRPAAPSRRKSAGEQYRAAFERLKANKPELLPVGTPVSQNNVAKEAGSDPSALKKTRFPLLIAEIQKYVESHVEDRPASVRQVRLAARKKNRSVQERLAAIVQQRDHLASLLVEADATILELMDRVAELERKLPASNIASLDRRESGKT